MVCGDWLFIDVEQNNKEYTFAIHGYGSKYTEQLYNKVGETVTLAGLIQGATHLAIINFNVRYICK